MYAHERPHPGGAAIQRRRFHTLEPRGACTRASYVCHVYDADLVVCECGRGARHGVDAAAAAEQDGPGLEMGCVGYWVVGGGYVVYRVDGEGCMG